MVVYCNPMLTMTDPRLQDWLSRLARNGPWLGSMLIAALIAIELARITVMVAGSNQLRSVALPGAHPGPAMSDGMRRAAINVQSVANAHLFGIAAPDPSTQDPNNAPPTTANLVLAGTIATQDPTHGVAIISDGGPSKVYSVGDNLSGFRLHSVYLDHVILDRGGSLETLSLPRQLPASHVAAVRPGAQPAVENLKRMVAQDPNILAQIMRAVPSYDSAAGKLRGFRIYPGKNRSAFNNLGLRPGDLVTAINGTPLDDPQRGQEIMNTVETADRATVTIERGGQAQDLTLNIAQVATEATNGIASAAAEPNSPDSAPATPNPAAVGRQGSPLGGPGGLMNRLAPGGQGFGAPGGLGGPGRRGNPGGSIPPMSPTPTPPPAPEPDPLPDDR
jgi:general secretion pathway protein C